MKNTFYRKGMARIYTNKKENINRIKEIIEEMDDFEFAYMPNELIAVFDGKISEVYNGKFDDIDLNQLMVKCWNEGIYVFYSMSNTY